MALTKITLILISVFVLILVGVNQFDLFNRDQELAAADQSAELIGEQDDANVVSTSYLAAPDESTDPRLKKFIEWAHRTDAAKWALRAFVAMFILTVYMFIGLVIVISSQRY